MRCDAVSEPYLGQGWWLNYSHYSLLKYWGTVAVIDRQSDAWLAVVSVPDIDGLPSLASAYAKDVQVEDKFSVVML